MKIHMMIQGSPEWHQVRKGIPTCSEFDKILTPVTRKPSSSQQGYIYSLIADVLRREPKYGSERYTSHAMAAGTEAEPKARAWYEMESGSRVQQIGFYDNGRYGGSPDGIIVGTPEDAAYISRCGATGEDLDITKLSVRGGLELKCPTLEVHLKYLFEGGLPDEARCQVHGHLALSGFDWWDYLSYNEDAPPHKVRVYPDAFTLALKSELDRFYDKYLAALEKIRGVALPPATEQPIL